MSKYDAHDGLLSGEDDSGRGGESNLTGLDRSLPATNLIVPMPPVKPPAGDGTDNGGPEESE